MLSPPKMTFVAKVILFCTALLISQASTTAQEQHLPLMSQGPIPDQVFQLAIEKILDTDLKGTSRVEQKARSEFEMGATFFLDFMLKRGNVVFGTPYNDYIDEVAANLLIDHPELASRVRIYILMTSDVNAFIFKDGVILITAGLLAYMENEAQLAFVIAHEIAHWIKEHAWEFYLEGYKVLVNAARQSSINYEEEVLRMFKYSRDNEYEADLIGYEDFYKESGYHHDALEALMMMLHRSDLPYANINFDPGFFGEGYFNPEDEDIYADFYVVDHTKRPIEDEEEKEEMRTHPDMEKRIDEIRFFVEEDKDTTIVINHFIISEERFFDMQRAMRQEMSILYLQDQQYEFAIYQAWLNHDSTQFQEKQAYAVAYSLYAITMDRLRTRTRTESSTDEFVYSGELLRVFACAAFFRQHPKLLASLALKHFVELYNQSGGRRGYLPYIHDLVDAINDEWNADLMLLADPSPDRAMLRRLNNMFERDSLYLPIREITQTETFADILKSLPGETPAKRLTVLQPRFLLATNKNVKLMRSEQNKEKTIHDIQNSLQKLDIAGEVLDAILFKKHDIERFNRMTVAVSWLDEFLEVNDKRNLTPHIRPVSGFYMQEIQGNMPDGHALMIPYLYSNHDIHFRPFRLIWLTVKYAITFPLTPLFMVNDYGFGESGTTIGAVVIDTDNLTVLQDERERTWYRYQHHHANGIFYQYLFQFRKESRQ